MKDLRLLGNMIKKLSQEQHVKLESALGWSEDQVAAIFDGRVFPSFHELEKLASIFKVSVPELLHGDESYYEQNVVHCMGSFENPDNREAILDIIDDYIMLQKAVH